MSLISTKELQHLAKLCSISISSEDEDRLLPQLEKIIEFIGKLQSCDVSVPHGYDADEESIICNEGVVESTMKEGFLSNTHHQVENDMIVLETTTNET